MFHIAHFYGSLSNDIMAVKGLSDIMAVKGLSDIMAVKGLTIEDF